jgi:hypothetical protein
MISAPQPKWHIQESKNGFHEMQMTLQYRIGPYNIDKLTSPLRCGCHKKNTSPTPDLRPSRDITNLISKRPPIYDLPQVEIDSSTKYG